VSEQDFTNKNYFLYVQSAKNFEKFRLFTIFVNALNSKSTIQVT